MILASAALVAAAAALLVDGVFFSGNGPGTPWQIWGSIAGSAAAAALLVAAAMRERARLAAVGAGERADADSATTGGPGAVQAPTLAEIRIPASARSGDVPPAAAAAVAVIPSDVPRTDGAAADAAVDAAADAARADDSPDAPVEDVVVVPGRRHYHRVGCPELAGEAGFPLGAGEARGAGYAGCERCRPDGAGGPEIVADEPRREPEAAEPVGVPVVPVVLVRRHFHRPECPYVGVASERRETTKAAARSEGALPCGVCRP